MKKIFKYMAAALLAVNFTSCSDFLDKEVDLTLDAEQVFQKFENPAAIWQIYIPTYRMRS